MLCILRDTILVFLLIQHVSTYEENAHFIKPSFAPYCTIKDQCKSACSCRGPSGCNLSPMDNTIRSGILFYLNQIREIQTLSEPEPSGMTMLQYDMQLEEVSTCFALSCETKFTTCFITPRFPETSQSVFQLEYGQMEYSNSTFAWIQILSYWFGEAKSLTADLINVMPGGEKGEKLHNFAQSVSDNIRFVGCAWSKLNNTLTFVCTYGPRGPAWGESIYKRGKACTTCPKGYSCENVKPFQNLCKSGVGVTTLLTVVTPPLPPPLAPIRAPPFPPPLAVSREPLPTTTNPPQPPPIPPEKKCPGALSCVSVLPSPELLRKSLDHSRNTDQRSDSRGFQEQSIKNPSSHLRLHQNNPPFVPLRNIPHSRILSSSLISQPSIPIRSRLTSAIGRNKSHSLQNGHRKQSRITEVMDSEPSQLVHSYHSSFDSSLNEPALSLSLQDPPTDAHQYGSRVFHENKLRHEQRSKQIQYDHPQPVGYDPISLISSLGQEHFRQVSGPRRSHDYESNFQLTDLPISQKPEIIGQIPLQLPSSQIQSQASSSFKPSEQTLSELKSPLGRDSGVYHLKNYCSYLYATSYFIYLWICLILIQFF